VNLPYYKINKLLWRWNKEEGARIVRNISLSLDGPPPAREEAKPSPAAAPKKPRPQVGDGLLKMMELHSRLKTWLETPDPSRPPKPIKPVKLEKTVPPFDIQEIPAAMRKTYLPKSAALMERWFAGKINYSPTDADESAEINQDGESYPPDFYDTTTITLDWVLQFARAKAKYDYLVKEAIRSPKAIEALHDILAPYQGQTTDIFPSDICEGNPISLHRHFQFQRIPYVESSLTLPYIDESVALGNPVIKGNVYYPIHNSDFRRWAIKHQRGGDFVVYSDRRFIPVAPPVKVYL
jgi:hypothetical protein